MSPPSTMSDHIVLIYPMPYKLYCIYVISSLGSAEERQEIVLIGDRVRIKKERSLCLYRK